MRAAENCTLQQHATMIIKKMELGVAELNTLWIEQFQTTRQTEGAELSSTCITYIYQYMLPTNQGGFSGNLSEEALRRPGARISTLKAEEKLCLRDGEGARDVALVSPLQL